MRIERSITTVSWIPSDLIEGSGKLATRLGVAHDDAPPPDTLGADVEAAVELLRAGDGCRFANHLRAFVETDDDGNIVDHGYLGAGTLGATTLHLGLGSITVPAVHLPDRRSEPEALERGAGMRFTQTVGGRTGVPIPRTVRRPPFVQYRAPIVWTTLELTIQADGSHEGRLIGASEFPRHWVYDDDGGLVAKSGLADYKSWAGDSFGSHTPWGDADSPALVTEVETILERELSATIMRGGLKPDIRRLKEGRVLVEQGSLSDDIFLLLDGVLVIEVNGEALAELGPGAVLGERAALEGGRRTATLRAVTDCKLAAVPADRMDAGPLAELASRHRREERSEA